MPGPEAGALIGQLEIVIVSDHIALRSDTWQREVDLLGMPRAEAVEKMQEETGRLEASGWKIVDEREECRRPKQRLLEVSRDKEADE